jgi:hypothetical protein
VFDNLTHKDFTHKENNEKTQIYNKYRLKKVRNMSEQLRRRKKEQHRYKCRTGNVELLGRGSDLNPENLLARSPWRYLAT